MGALVIWKESVFTHLNANLTRGTLSSQEEALGLISPPVWSPPSSLVSWQEGKDVPHSPSDLGRQCSCQWHSEECGPHSLVAPHRRTPGPCRLCALPPSFVTRRT